MSSPPSKDRSTQRYTVDGRREVAVALILAHDPQGWGLVFVTSRNHVDKLTLPKGGWESFETVEHAALREAHEEGGVVCQPLPKDAVGPHWQHRTADRENDRKGSKNLLHVIPLVFEKFDNQWLEQFERRRFIIPAVDVIESESVSVGTEKFRVKSEFRRIVVDHFCDENFLAILSEITSRQ